jgi:hypothetical protein
VEKGDTINVHIQFSENAARWGWEVTLSYPVSDNGNASDERIEQSTHLGDLRTAPLADSAMPTRSPDGEIDLFILQKMDGKQTILEIAQETAVHFPLQFANDEQATIRVQQTAAYYGWRQGHDTSLVAVK